MVGGENHEHSRFCIGVSVPRGGRKLAVLRLQHGATLQSAVEAFIMKFTEDDGPPLPPLRSLH